MPPSGSDLLAWYDRHRRALPWRALPGETADPYRVWLSEIMLQQTTVVAVKPYFARFLALFPDIHALARAPTEQVMSAWAGLGYYARARNLHACARAVAALGDFPRDLEGLRALPGIGDYTARAIAAIAFGLPVVPVDGNVERVTSRVFRIETPLPGGKPALARAAATLNADPEARARASDFAQSLFDLGATICTPRAPACGLCPWASTCAVRGDTPERLPARSPKRARPQRHGVHFALRDASGAIWLRTRAPSGLLGGMTELPGTPWRETLWNMSEALAFAPAAMASWRPLGVVRHVFTHFALTIDVVGARIESFDGLAGGFGVGAASLVQQALPSLMRKCIALAEAPDDDGRMTMAR